MTAGDFFSGQRAGGFDSLGAAVFGRRQRRLRLRFLQRSGKTIELGAQHRFVDSRQHLAALHAIARFHQHGRETAAFAFRADGHVVTGVDGAGEAHRGGHGLYARRHDADERQLRLREHRCGRRLRRHGVACPEKRGDEHGRNDGADDPSPWVVPDAVAHADGRRCHRCGRFGSGRCSVRKTVPGDPGHRVRTLGLV